MPLIHIERSILVNKSAKHIFESLINFNEWLFWSPWLIMEKDAQVTVSEDARYYEWKGNRIGEGNMTVLNVQENESIEYDLTFLKPWKSHSKVTFKMDEKGDKTVITWMMDSKLPFFMFWMKNSMEAFIGMDYERGLRLLKDYLENGEVSSSIKILGQTDFRSVNYVGIRSSCKFDELSKCMASDFGALEGLKNIYPDIIFDKALTIYKKWDIKSQNVIYTACLTVNKIPADLDQTYTSGNIPATKVYTVRHSGSYQHLGNAWATMMNIERAKEFTSNKKISPFEHYVSDPREVPEKNLITDIIFPIK